MVALSPYMSSLAPTAVIIGLALLLLPFLDRNDTRVRAPLLLLTVVLSARYLWWRFTATLPAFDGGIGIVAAYGFAILEAMTVVSSCCAFLILSRTKDRRQEADNNAQWWRPGPSPAVDVYIATYNEDRDVLERTIIGAKSLLFGTARIFVLDDGRRPWLAEACLDHGIDYITRPDNAHAKAGNLNHALKLRLADSDAPDFIAVLDADFVPHQNFVSRCLALFHDKQAGLVQTPQHFFNPDPIQHNLGIARAYPDEQRFFFDHVEPARDAWGIAVCAGTSSMVRVEALKAIGGFPTESVTEDFLLTLRLAENGWRTVYLNEPLTEGLAPEGLKEYIVQRSRWCLGMMQIARGPYSPWGAHRLGLIHRLSVLDSLLYWTSTFPFRLASLIGPLLYWFLGITVVNATVPDVLSNYLPLYVSVLILLNWISRGLILPLINDVSQLVAAWPITRAAFVGLFTPGPHRFRVTAKGGDRDRVVIQWPVLMPFAILFGLTIAGLLVSVVGDYNFDQVADDGVQVILLWTIYNLAVLAVTMAACIERPRANRPQRLIEEATILTLGGDDLTGWLTDLGTAQARVRGPHDLAIGAEAVVGIPEVGDVACHIEREAHDGYWVRLQPTSHERDLILKKLHTAAATPGAVRGDLALMFKDFVRQIYAR